MFFCCKKRKVGIVLNVLKRWMQPIVTFFLFPYFLYYVVRYEEVWAATGIVGVWAIQVGYPIGIVLLLVFMIKKRIPRKLKKYLRKKECYLDKYFYRGYAIAFVGVFVLQYPLLWGTYLIGCLPEFICTLMESFCENVSQSDTVASGLLILLTRLIEIVLIIASPIIEIFMYGVIALVIPLICLRLSVWLSRRLRAVPELQKYRGKKLVTVCRQAIEKYCKRQYNSKLQKDTYECCLEAFRDSGDYAVLLKDNQIFEEVNRLFVKSIRTEYDLIPIVNEDRDSYLETNQDKFKELEQIMKGIYGLIRERCDWIRNKRYIINSLKYSKWSKADTDVDDYANQIMDMESNFMELKRNFEDVKCRFEDVYSELGKEYYGIHKGIEGEKLVSNLLEKYTDSLVFFSGISLKYGNEKCEIDDLIVCPQGIFVVEVKNIGNSKKTITIDKTGRWQDSSDKDKYASWNAKIQNDKHVRICEKIVNEILGRNISTRLYAQGVIVIANDQMNIVNHSDQKIVRVNGLIDVIRANQNCLSGEEMHLICERIEDYCVPTTMYEVARYDKIADAFDDFFNEIEIRLTRCENLAVWQTELDKQMAMVIGFNNKKKEDKYGNRY